jgi:hypothetical protein
MRFGFAAPFLSRTRKPGNNIEYYFNREIKQANVAIDLAIRIF